jgi:large subunit ribosomal protein L10
MSKALKREMAREIQQEMEAVDSFILFNFNKLRAQDSYELRRSLYQQDIKVRVVKNTLAGIAFSEYYPEEIREFLKGPTAVAYGGDNVVSVAKALVDWNKKAKNIEIKGGYLPGQVLQEKDVVELSKTPPREVLLAMLAGAFEGPLQQIATIMAASMQNVSNATGALVEKMEEKGVERVSDL